MLEQLLQRHWTDFLDQVRLMRTVMENIRDTSFRIIKQQNIPPNQVKLSVTKLSVDSKRPNLEIWVEFSIPKEKGVVVGTSICDLSLDGSFSIKESFGTHFTPET